MQFTELDKLDADFAGQFSDPGSAGEILGFLKEETGAGGEFAVSADGDFLLVRGFDRDGYYFLYPFLLGDGETEERMIAVLRAVAGYACRQEIPLVFREVPEEELSLFADAGFTAMEADGDDTLTVRLQNELEAAKCGEETPAEIFGILSDDAVSLSEWTDADAPSYAALARDGETNRYWGYQLDEDFETLPSDADLILRTRDEWRRNVACSFAIRAGGAFVGEAVLYAFDRFGGAEVGIRLLPECRGRGYARPALALLETAAGRIGLLSLSAVVHRENLSSQKLFSLWGESGIFDEKSVVFRKKL